MLISYGAWEKGKGMSFAEMCSLVAEEAKTWADEFGLVKIDSSPEDLISIQVLGCICKAFA